MLKIAIVTNNYKPYAGGVVSSIDAFVGGLRQMGHEVIIVTLDFSGSHRREKGLYRISCPIRFRYKKNPMAIPLRATQELEQILTEFSPDIVHSQHPFLLGVSAVKVCKKLQLPLVFTHHTQYAKYSHYVPLPTSLVRPAINYLVESYAQEVKGIIAPSQEIQYQLEEKGVKTKIQVIPSPIQPLFFEQIDYGGRSKSDKVNLITVSRFMPEKNLLFLLDVVAQLDPERFQFTLVGFGEQQSELEEYAYDRLGMSNKQVKFVIKPQRKRLKKLYDQADLFLFASQTETQGLVLAEAMACGLPVIALDSPPLRDIVQSGKNGYLVSSGQEMKRSIIESMDGARYKALQANAQQTAYRYSVMSLCSTLTHWYQGILKG